VGLLYNELPGTGANAKKEIVMTRLARDIMSREVISVPTSMDLRDLAKLFLEQGITGAPVVDSRGELAGVVSQTDLIYYGLTRDDELVLDSLFYQTARMEGQHIPRGFQIEDTNTGVVEDVMTPLVHAVTERASVDAVVRMMTRKHIHRVIVRKGRKVTGIISALDVLKSQVNGEKPLKATKQRTAKKKGGTRSARKRRSAAVKAT
jgi:CBS domain-containing protein